MYTEFQQQQQHVDNVLDTITEQISWSEEEASQLKSGVIDIRKHFWEEIKVNMDSFDDFLETVISLRQEAQALAVSQSTHKHASNRLSTLYRMQKVPYFGRIDFLEEGIRHVEQVYIGVSSLMDTSGEQFLVYDWRSPIASVYYDHQPGPAKYVTPGGIIQGELKKKWQYVIRAGVLQSMFDTSLTIGDEILQQVLGQGTDKHMHSIVATIQQEQNRIIRHDRGKLLIVHGAAGSGKTSAALQRIAYFLYKYRSSLSADQIILFSPNTMFNSYVSNVLPELGEANMQQVTFQEYLDHRLSTQFQVENPYEQLEYILTTKSTPSYRARVTSIRYKASIPFFELMKSYRTSLELSGMRFKDMNFRDRSIVTAKQMENVFYNENISNSFHSRLEKLKEWLMQQLKEVEKAELTKSWVQEEIELLSNAAYHKAHAYLAEKRGFEREAVYDYEMEPEALAQLIVRQKLKPLAKSISTFDFINTKEIYKQLFADCIPSNPLLDGNMPTDWEHICRETQEALDEGKLYYEDATPFLLLQELIVGFQTNGAIKHILIDEGQDYSPFQFEFLKRLFPAARMTVLGDFNQAIFAHASDLTDFQMLSSLYGQDESEVINMTRSYRSTKSIIEFTRKLVPNGEQIIAFDRSGSMPVLTQLSDEETLHRSIASKVEVLRQSGYHSIAIICKSAEESKHAYDALCCVSNIKLIKNDSLEYEQGVVIIPSYLSKGIEFEAVIIYNASAVVYGDESLRKVFYTACTRAMHDLQLYSIGEPSPFLRDTLQENLIQS